MTISLDKPQIITHATKSLAYTPYDVKWIPGTAKFTVVGQTPRATALIQTYELDNGSIKLIAETEKPHSIKCSTMAASPVHKPALACGDFNGHLTILDIETNKEVFNVKAHDQIVNCIDGCGGNSSGAPELATASRDGVVKIWDARQTKPVASIVPADGEVRDTWSVAFGNSYNDTERVIAAGYENGDVKLFDLKAMKLVWETNVKNGVCALEFDRRDIKMNKIVVGGLESAFSVFDLRTMHPSKGFASVAHKTNDNTTVWITKHLPQNRDIFVTSGGNGALNLYKYNYPAQRSKKSGDDLIEGVPGTLQLLQTANVAEQPINAFDWSPDKQGLCVFSAYDQTVRIGIVTKLNTL